MQRNHVVLNLHPNRLRSEHERRDKVVNDLFAKFFIAAEEDLKQVATTHDPGDLAAVVDHDEAPHVAFLHQTRCFHQTRVDRDCNRRRGHDVLCD